MRAVVQRVMRGEVTSQGELLGAIGRGLLVLLGVGHADTRDDADWLADRVVDLRVFADEAGKTNLSLGDVGGAVLVVSQFTLYADARRGRRPSFTDAAPPGLAVPLYERFIARLRGRGCRVETGRFGADMQVSLVNDGPVTLWLERVAGRCPETLVGSPPGETP
ncbi:MAG: D-aminoacyl-tRNA deacylase [Candidatus Sericytochromatia bacterium]|nr:D-aminoacyl-tRNA deacylase [Candidatus Sericytochromatia bacterium]